MSEEDRRRGSVLLPSMIVASLVDLAVVASGAIYLAMLSQPERIAASRVATAVMGALGLDERAFIALAGVGVLAVSVIGNGLTVFTVYRVHAFSWSQIVGIGGRVLGGYLHRPYLFFLTRSVPDLSTRTVGEVTAVVKVLVHIMQTISRMGGAFLVLAWLGWQEPLLALAMLGFMGTGLGGLYSLSRRWTYSLGKQKTKANKARARAVLEALQGAKEIKLNGLEEVALTRFRRPSRELASVMRRHTALNATTKAGLETMALAGLVVAVLYFYAADRDMKGVLPIVGAYAVAAFRMLPTLQSLFQTLSEIRLETHALELIHADVTSAPPPAAAEAGVPPVEFERAVELSDLGFRYPSGQSDVIAGLNLTLRKGTWTALVGSTGSGKTTIVDLSMALLAPTSGRVLVDGRAIHTPGEVLAWQKHVGYVPQTIFVTDDTLAANIAFGQKDVDMPRVVEAAKQASLHDFVTHELPEGYQTRLGHNGLRLSGGQRQRVGLARAIYRNPAFLVLDEATSALDNHTEAAVMRSLRDHHRSTTVLMVAHRLTTTRHCDRIVMLDHGRIVASGSYDELYAGNDAFRALVDAGEGEAAPDAVEPPEPAERDEPLDDLM